MALRVTLISFSVVFNQTPSKLQDNNGSDELVVRLLPSFHWYSLTDCCDYTPLVELSQFFQTNLHVVLADIM